MSVLGLGCWPIGAAWAAGDQPLGYTSVDDTTSLRALHRGIEIGVTLLDTADVYGAGHSERLVGKAVADHPDVLVATKFGYVFDESTRQLTGEDTSPEYVRRALHASLRRLGRERVDLYQLHLSDVDDRRAADIIATLEDLVAEGLVAWYGISADDAGPAEAFAAGPHCTAVQFELNVFGGSEAVLAVCDRHDLAALCRSPLAMGLLGGRYGAGTRLPADDVRGRPPSWLEWFSDGGPNPAFLSRLELVREALTTGGRTLAQGALGWVWAHHERTIPLPGFRTPGQVEENVAAADHGPLDRGTYTVIERALGRPA